MAETVAEAGEFGLIRRLDRLLKEEGAANAGLTVGIGDDAAAFRPRPGFDLLVTCDCLVEGRHFLPALTTPFLLGRRAMAVNLSDVGAMGGRPLHAVVSLGLTPATLVEDVEAMYRGFLAELNPLGATVIGGNITRVDGAAFVDVTLLGEVEPDRCLRRSGARAGDALLVTGCPGQAAAGLRLLLAAASPHDLFDHPLARAYNDPGHRAREGRAVALSGAAHALIDTSDGLLGDLGHLCEESGVGAELFADRLPVSEALRGAAGALGRDPLAWVLGESDDYELLVACPPEAAERVRAAVASVGDAPLTEIGRLTSEPLTLYLNEPGGGRRRLSPAGWDHFAPEGETP